MGNESGENVGEWYMGEERKKVGVAIPEGLVGQDPVT